MALEKLYKYDSSIAAFLVRLSQRKNFEHRFSSNLINI